MTELNSQLFEDQIDNARGFTPPNSLNRVCMISLVLKKFFFLKAC
jgi:hypothetical protein